MATRRGMSLEEEIARKVGVTLADGRIYRNGVLTSAADAQRSATSRARDLVLDAQTGQRVLGGFNGDAQRAAAETRLNPISNPNLRPIAPQVLASGLGGGGMFGTMGGGFGLGGSGRGNDSPVSLDLARSTLLSNAGSVFGRNYDQSALSRATPAQIQSEAARLPSLLAAQRTLGAANGLLPDRTYDATTLGRATPEQTLAEASTIDTRLQAQRQRERTGVAQAVFGALGGGAAATGGISRADAVDAAVNNVVSRVAQAPGATLQDVQSAAAIARQTFDPTGEIAFERQLQRDGTLEDARIKRDDVRATRKEAQADQAGVNYLRLSDELELAQQNLQRATALTAQQEAAVLGQALEQADVGDGFFGIGNTRAKINSLADARRVLAGNPRQLALVEEAYQALSQPIMQGNLTLAPAKAAQRAAVRAEARVKALERRGVLPTDRSYQLYDQERGGGDGTALSAAGTRGPVRAPAQTPAWMQAAGLAPTNGVMAAAPAMGGFTADEIAQVFPQAAPAAAAPYLVPSVGDALSREGLMGLFPGGRTNLAIAERVAPAASWLSNLGQGSANYLYGTAGGAVDSTRRIMEAPSRAILGGTTVDAAQNQMAQSLQRASDNVLYPAASGVAAFGGRFASEVAAAPRALARIFLDGRQGNAEAAAVRADITRRSSPEYAAAFRQQNLTRMARSLGLPDNASEQDIIAARRAALAVLR